MLVKKEKIFDNIVAVSGTKKEAIRTISRLCAKQTMLDATQLEKAFWKREEWDSTGCGEGIAIPHAIIKEIDEVQLFIVRFRYPIEWESFDDKKSRCCICDYRTRREGTGKISGVFVQACQKTCG